ncbi:hypothetical protein CF386_09460 [Paraphotobacterium marinum]|uniref:HTH LytTR-type domain-containing protein n=1 Tax=Paraphotobacterium marinum TaxID=1755811 RepID=A0A220VFZ8_9GAMM|nr:LytTR family DNA-binding domain-containing protein [Paraphotobacterium marinum]ASK79287.1 hypothetical protein CF386_09460 [Paraphotobacterium marinum]
MNKFKKYYKNNPFYFIFLGIVFFKYFVDTFQNAITRVRTLDSVNVTTSLKYQLFIEVENHLFGFIFIAFSLYWVGRVFSNESCSFLYKARCLITVILLYCCFIYIAVSTTDIVSIYLFHPEIIGKAIIAQHSFFYIWLQGLKIIFNWNGFFYYVFISTSPALHIITYAFFVSFLKKEQLTILTRGFLEKVGRYNAKLQEKQDSTDNNSKKSILPCDALDSNTAKEPVDLIEVFIAKKLNKEFFISVKDIISIHSDGNYVELITYDDSFLIRATLKNILPQLPDFYMKIHRSALININQVNDIKIDNEDRKMYAIMKNNTEISISRSNQKEFKMKWARN